MNSIGGLVLPECGRLNDTVAISMKRSTLYCQPNHTPSHVAEIWLRSQTATPLPGHWTPTWTRPYGVGLLFLHQRVNLVIKSNQTRKQCETVNNRTSTPQARHDHYYDARDPHDTDRPPFIANQLLSIYRSVCLESCWWHVSYNYNGTFGVACGIWTNERTPSCSAS